MTIEDKQHFMSRALELAKQGAGWVSPNPMVGCVIVKNNQIIAEGKHEKYGGPHAEVNAVNQLEKIEMMKGSTVFVTLEPCAHVGKTPPCAELLVRCQPARVIVCNVDPNPLVAGKGIDILEKASITTETGVLAEEGAFLNRRFFKRMTQKEPYIILKWAQTADRFVARKNYDSKWISNEKSRALVHQWRHEEDAIMVGTNTAIYDNPRLNIRHGNGQNPIRVVIDRTLKVPNKHHLFDQRQKTICYNEIKEEKSGLVNYVKLNFKENVVEQVLNDLYQRDIQSIIIEGGSFLLQQFVDLSLIHI